MKVGKWKLLGEKTRFTTKWWKVVERDYETFHKKRIKWFVLKKPNAISVFCLTREGKVVAINYFRPGIQKIVLDLPSGYMNKGEAPLESAKRELLEETGYKAEKFVKLGTYAGNAQGDTLLLHAYLALGGFKASEQNLDQGEEIEVKLFTPKQLLEKIRKGQFVDSTRIALVFLALEKLGKLKFKL